MKSGNISNNKLSHIIMAFVVVVLLGGWSGGAENAHLKKIGYIKAKSSGEINNSPWGIQAGTLDEKILKKAAEIGVKWTRLGADWSGIERSKGIYSWEETDKAFSAALAIGITPFVTIGGSNKIYTTPRTDLDPKVEEIYGNRPGPPTQNQDAMKAWLNFVRQVVSRYKDKIKYWEVWNEPNHFAYWGAEPDGKEYGRLLKESAVVIKETDPKAYVLAGAMAGLDPLFTEAFLSAGTKDLIDIITFHNYGSIPEERIYKAIKVWDVIKKYNPAIKLWQGECGYPSHSSSRDYRGISPWGPTIQAKWLLRQAFTDIYFCGASMSNYFKLFDGGRRGEMPKRSFLSGIDSVLGFPEQAGSRVKTKGVNEKCLLENPNLKPKIGFYAYQNLCSVFDARFKPAQEKHTLKINSSGCFYGIGDEDDAFPSIPLVAKFKSSDGKNLVAYWLPWHPLELIEEAAIDLSVQNFIFKNPVLVNLLDGSVSEIHEFKADSTKTIFKNIPLADFPFVIMEREDLKIENK